MFTGIVADVGRVRRVEAGGERRFVIETGFDTATIGVGASIACAGVCLTVVGKGEGWFAAEASAETLARTTAADWREGTRLNLERALRLGDELGGHLVFGHVDGVARIVERRAEGESLRFVVEAPPSLSPYLAPKGSVALDGVSLTVNEVEGGRFGVVVVPHTREHTTFADARPGDMVNLEVDVFARYVARLCERG